MNRRSGAYAGADTDEWEGKAVNGFDRACSLLPEKQRAEALFLPQKAREEAESIRLRAGAGASVCGPDWERKLKGWIGRAEVEETLLRAARSSLYAAEDSLREGGLQPKAGSAWALRAVFS